MKIYKFRYINKERLLIGKEFIVYINKKTRFRFFLLRNMKEVQQNCFEYSKKQRPKIRFKEPCVKKDFVRKYKNSRWRFDINLWEEKKWYGYEYRIFSYPNGLKTTRTLLKKSKSTANYKGVCEK